MARESSVLMASTWSWSCLLPVSDGVEDDGQLLGRQEGVDILARGGTVSVSNVLTLSQNKRKKKVLNMHLLQVGN